MLSLLLVVALVTLLTLKCIGYLRALPPGPLIPLQILRRLRWSRFYGKSDIDIILGLKEEYGSTFSVISGYRKVVIMSDIDQVQVRNKYRSQFSFAAGNRPRPAAISAGNRKLRPVPVFPFSSQFFGSSELRGGS